jgi:hypothetical protein
MLQPATAALHCEAVKMLLSAGADASNPFVVVDEEGEAPVTVLPIQSVCYSGVYWPPIYQNFMTEELKYFMEGERVSESRGILRRMSDTVRTDALEIAMELVCWHEARGDGLFDGITKLHLAFHRSMVDEVRRLTDSGCNKIAKGS